jgi:hypothetical protein
MATVAVSAPKHRIIDTTADIASLMANLRSGDSMTREHARETLVAIGKPAVAVLIKAIGDRDRQVRWEAAKALAAIGDPDTAEALVTALGDERLGVRWIAAEGLIGLGIDALEPLLKALLEPANAVWMGEGAHHVLHDLSKKHSMPWLKWVMAALDESDPALAVPPVALTALTALRSVVRSGAGGVPVR